MYTQSTIISTFGSLIGFNKSRDPNVSALTNLMGSTSGMFYQEAHPLITIENLESVAPNFNSYTYAAYDNGTTYTLGDIVSSGGVNYIYINSSDDSGNPVSDATYWDNLFTDWLRSKRDSSIVKAINLWLDTKFKNKSAKNLLQDSRLFDFDGAGDVTSSQSTNFKGFEIAPKKTKGIKFKIREVGLQFPGNESVTISLYKVGNPTAIKTQAISYTGSGAVEWHDLTDFVLDGTGTYRVGYSDNVTYTNGTKDYSYLAQGVTICPRSTKYYQAKAFTSTDLADPSKTVYTDSDNYGINLEFELYCDYTEFIVDQKDLFKNLVYYQVALDLLTELIYNSNAKVNRNEANIDVGQVMLYEIHGDTQGRLTGIKEKLTSSLNSITFDESGISSECLTCRKKGIKYRNI